jgi:hypothetical protein
MNYQKSKVTIYHKAHPTKRYLAIFRPEEWIKSHRIPLIHQYYADGYLYMYLPDKDCCFAINAHQSVHSTLTKMFRSEVKFTKVSDAVLSAKLDSLFLLTFDWFCSKETFTNDGCDYKEYKTKSMQFMLTDCAQKSLPVELVTLKHIRGEEFLHQFEFNSTIEMNDAMFDLPPSCTNQPIRDVTLSMEESFNINLYFEKAFPHTNDIC